MQGVPGRFNLFDHAGATLIADYGHNPDAIAALIASVENLPARRRAVVISGAGDRRDQDIREQTQMLGAAFDDVILYQDACQRGRADGEVLALLRQGLQGAARTTHVEEIHGEFSAIDHALAGLQAGDLCLILIDQVQEALAYIQSRCDAANAAAGKAATPRKAASRVAPTPVAARRTAKRRAVRGSAQLAVAGV
jgi:cyanophycin synthetase